MTPVNIYIFASALSSACPGQFLNMILSYLATFPLSEIPNLFLSPLFFLSEVSTFAYFTTFFLSLKSQLALTFFLYLTSANKSFKREILAILFLFKLASLQLFQDWPQFDNLCQTKKKFLPLSSSSSSSFPLLLGSPSPLFELGWKASSSSFSSSSLLRRTVLPALSKMSNFPVRCPCCFLWHKTCLPGKQ